MKRLRRQVAILALLVCAAAAGAQTVVEVSGEAAITKGNVPAARLDAMARARWAAVLEAASVRTTSSTLVKDNAVLDDLLINRTDGVITKSQVLDETETNGIYAVRLRAEVAQDPARLIISQIARNQAIAVYLPAIFPDASIRETHALTTRLIGALTDVGYEVVDVANTDLGRSYQRLQDALRTNNYESMRAVLYKYLTNCILVGTLELAHTGRRGSPDSLGPLPLDFVTATLTYRVVVGDDASLRTVLVSNQISVKGAGSNPAHAAEKAIKEMVDTAVDPLVTQMLQRIRARAPKIRVYVNGVNSSASDRTIRQAISAIPWVAGVETSRFGEYVVEYPERVAYLAASISQLPGFRVADFSPTSVLVRFEGSP